MEEEIGKFLNSVFNWLIWSPVGLQLSIENSQLIFSVAALWLINQTNMGSGLSNVSLTNSSYLNQLSSFYASSILPSFWHNIAIQTKNNKLRSFANKVRLILRGELPQLDVSQFLIS
jgi:hypothetical protein